MSGRARRSRSHSSSSSSSGSERSRSSSSSSRSRSSKSRSRSPDRRSPISPTRGAKEAPRIPKKSDYAAAINEVPPPPKPVKQAKRVRINLEEDRKLVFESSARGVFLSHTDRNSLLAELPAVASPLALVPVVDPEITKILKGRDKGLLAALSDQELKGMHSCALTSLQLSEIIRKVGSDGSGAALPEKTLGYLDILEQMQSSIIKDLIPPQREIVLKRLGISYSHWSTAMPSYKKSALEGSHVSASAESELHPELFGPTLRNELSDGDNSLRKAIKTHTSSTHKRSYERKARKPSRGESPPAKRQKAQNNTRVSGPSASSKNKPPTWNKKSGGAKKK